MATYATWDSANKGASITLSGSDLTATGGLDNKGVRSTIGVSSGKWYWEISDVVPNVGSMIGVALSSVNMDATVFSQTGVKEVDGFDGSKFVDGANSGYTTSWKAGNPTTLSVALDMDGGTVNLWVSGVDKGNIATGLTGTFYALYSVDSSASSCTANFGATAFTYTPPGGYNAGLFTGTAGGDARSLNLLGVGT